MVCVEYCLFCDVCGANWCDGGEADLKPTERRRLARREGWSRRRREGELLDLCPDCSPPTKSE